MTQTFSNQGDKGTPNKSFVETKINHLMLYHLSIITTNILLFLQL